MNNRLEATKYYILNNLIMKIPSYSLRNQYMKVVCGMKLGGYTSVHMHCFITGNRISIGRHTVINRFCYLDGRADLTIGSNVNISHYVIIHTLTHDVQDPAFSGKCGPVVIDDDSWIGVRSIILPGVCIGRGAVVGAGSVVTRNVPNFAIVAGCPAKIIGYRNNDLKYTTTYFPFYDTDIQ